MGGEPEEAWVEGETLLEAEEEEPRVGAMPVWVEEAVLRASAGKTAIADRAKSVTSVEATSWVCV